MTRADLLAAQEAARAELLKQTAECRDPLNDCTASDGMLCQSFYLAAADYAAAAAAVDACPAAPPAGYVEVDADTNGNTLGVLRTGGENHIVATGSDGTEVAVHCGLDVVLALLDQAPAGVEGMEL